MATIRLNCVFPLTSYGVFLVFVYAEYERDLTTCFIRTVHNTSVPVFGREATKDEIFGSLKY